MYHKSTVPPLLSVLPSKVPHFQKTTYIVCKFNAIPNLVSKRALKRSMLRFPAVVALFNGRQFIANQIKEDAAAFRTSYITKKKLRLTNQFLASEMIWSFTHFSNITGCLMCEIFCCFLLSFPQNERNIYQFYSVSFAQFAYFFEESVFTF